MSADVSIPGLRLEDWPDYMDVETEVRFGLAREIYDGVASGVASLLERGMGPDEIRAHVRAMVREEERGNGHIRAVPAVGRWYGRCVEMALEERT